MGVTMIPNINSLTRYCERYSWGRVFGGVYLNQRREHVSLGGGIGTDTTNQLILSLCCMYNIWVDRSV